MDGGGRLDQSLKRSGPSATRWFGAPVDEPDRARAYGDQDSAKASFTLFFGGRRARRLAARLAQIPQGAGVAGSLLLLGATLSYGAIAGGHLAAVSNWLRGARDDGANALGFRIGAVSVTGASQVSRERALELAGVT